MIFDFLHRPNKFVVTSHGLTDVGKVRKINEDAFANCPNTGIWGVADGMGGHQAGDLASQSVTDCLQSLSADKNINNFAESVRNSLAEVNKRLFAEAQQRGGGSTIGCTLVLLLAAANKGALLWAGDSRAYRLRDGLLERMTRDHSQVEDLIAQGSISPEEAESHPLANAITNAIGPAAELYLEEKMLRIAPGDRFLLCSDGLYRELSEPDIAELMRTDGDTASTCDKLIGLALERGARDNVTVLVVDFSPHTSPTQPKA